jgi:TolB protein
MRPVGDKVEVRFALMDAVKQTQLVSMTYVVTPAQFRATAHKIADVIYEKLTGDAGVFSTRIAYITKQGNRFELIVADADGGNPQAIVGSNEPLLSPAWSPDGTRIAFMSNRDGNPEIYVANRDGSNIRRLTNNPSADASPTWSPSGTQVAFTSDRSGSPAIYLIASDGLGGLQRLTTDGYADKASWSPAPFNEIAYTSRNGPGFDIKVIDVGTRQVRQLTFGDGSNESPSFSPNGRHIAFMSTRAGKSQIFTMAKDGKNVKQITKTGANEMPDWSK